LVATEPENAKIAVAVFPALTVTEQLLAVAPPDAESSQWSNVHPLAGVAVRATVWEELPKAEEHDRLPGPQLTPVPVTVPWPMTSTVRVGGGAAAAAGAPATPTTSTARSSPSHPLMGGRLSPYEGPRGPSRRRSATLPNGFTSP